MSSMRLHFLPLLLLVCLLAAMPLTLSNDTTAQGSVPAGEYTPALPEGPPVQVQPVNTVPPETPAGVPTSEPNPNEPPTAEPNPNEPPPTAEPNPNEPPPTEPLLPNAPPPPAPDEPDDSPSVEIVPGSDLEPRITPVVIVTPSAGDPPLLSSATITIRTRVCDNEGFDPYFSWNLAELTTECPLSTSMFGFSMSRPGLGYSKTSFGGVVTFSVPPLTTVKIQSAERDGYDEPVHVCQSAATSEFWGRRQQTWDTLPAENVECIWFFVQNNDDINLELYKLNCPWFAPESLSTENVFCDGTTLGTFGEVRLSDTNPATADLVRAAGSRAVNFIDLPPGTYTVTETGVSTGVAWSYWGHCFNADPADGSPDPTFLLVKSTSFTITLSEVGDTVRCTSTNVAASAPSSVTIIESTVAFPGGPPIDIIPPGMEPSGEGIGLIPLPSSTPDEAPPPAPDEPDAPPTGLPILPGSDRPKPNIPPLVPQTPTPTLVPIFPVETEEPTVTPVPPTGESTVTPVPPTAVTGSGNLTIYSRTCDNQGFNPHFGGTLATFLVECPAADREFEFTLLGNDGYTKTVSTKGGVINEVVPAPGVGFRRAAAPGFDLSFTSCSNDSFNKDYPKSIAHYSGAAVAGGDRVTCYWFNVLDSTDINISVNTYNCPAVSPLTTPSVIPREFELDPICPTWPLMGGVTVTLADGDSTTADQVKVTGSEAGAQFIDLPVGTYTITVIPPPGATHAYLLSCQGNSFGGPPLTTPVAATAISDFVFTVPITVPGETYTCGVYIVKP